VELTQSADRKARAADDALQTVAQVTIHNLARRGRGFPPCALCQPRGLWPLSLVSSQNGKRSKPKLHRSGTPLAIGIHSMNADEELRAAIARYLAALMARGYSAEQAIELLVEERKARIQNRRKALRVVDS